MPTAPEKNPSLSSSSVHLSPQTLDKHCVIHLPKLAADLALEQGEEVQAGAQGAAFRAFLPPDSSWYHGCELGMSKDSS